MPVLHLHTGKLYLQVGLSSLSKPGYSDSPQTLRPGFPSGISRRSTTKNTIVSLVGTQEMHLFFAKVGVTHTYATENEEKPGGFAERSLKD